MDEMERRAEFVEGRDAKLVLWLSLNIFVTCRKDTRVNSFYLHPSLPKNNFLKGYGQTIV